MKCMPASLRNVLSMFVAVIFVCPSYAVTIEKSDKVAFVCDQIADVEPEFRSVAALGKVAQTRMSPQDADRIALSKSGVPDGFLKYLRNFLKPEYVPMETYARENMIFARDVYLSGWGQPQGKGDVVYLPYQADGRDFLVSQTFDGFSSSIGISMSLKPSEQFEPGRHDEIKSNLKSLWDTYFLPDAQAPVELTVEPSKGLDTDLLSAKRAEGGKFNYRQTLKGTYSPTGICLVFMKLRYYPGGFKDMLPDWSPPPDKYFDWILGRYEAPKSNSKKRKE